jgi:hypothetical protein
MRTVGDPVPCSHPHPASYRGRSAGSRDAVARCVVTAEVVACTSRIDSQPNRGSTARAWNPSRLANPASACISARASTSRAPTRAPAWRPTPARATPSTCPGRAAASADRHRADTPTAPASISSHPDPRSSPTGGCSSRRPAGSTPPAHLDWPRALRRQVPGRPRPPPAATSCQSPAPHDRRPSGHAGSG